MTTSASIQISNPTASTLFYQVIDGYPSFVLNHLAAWLNSPAAIESDSEQAFLQGYGASVAIEVDVDPLDNGEDADWVYLIDQTNKTLTIQHRQDTGDQSPVNPLEELEVILEPYKPDVQSSIGRAMVAISQAGYTLTVPS
jgi:hypothetical protein